MTEDISAEIRYLKEKYDRAPESRLFAPLADAYRKIGQVDRAIELCEAGLIRYPDYASAHVILGKCFYDKGATERSRAEFLRVIELDPENMVALKFMGDIQLAEGKRDDAVSYLRKLLAIDPTNGEAAAMLEGIEGEFKSREIDLETAQRVHHGSQTTEMATMTLAGIYAAQGYYTKALKIYREILDAQPQNSEAKRMIGKIEEMIASSDREREESFDDDVMTISIEDVSEELASRTTGRGTGPAVRAGGDRDREDAEEQGEGERGSDRPAADLPPGSVLGDEDELEQVARELEEADRISGGTEETSEAAESTEETDRVTGTTREGMDHFRKWLEKMQQREADESRDDE